MRLFIDRATAALPSFHASDENIASIVKICRHLDGIPLAIELAAAKIRVLGVDQIAERLGDRYRFLVGGSRTSLERHQTLRAAIDWSYNLLSPGGAETLPAALDLQRRLVARSRRGGLCRARQIRISWTCWGS